MERADHLVGHLREEVAQVDGEGAHHEADGATGALHRSLLGAVVREGLSDDRPDELHDDADAGVEAGLSALC